MSTFYRHFFFFVCSLVIHTDINFVDDVRISVEPLLFSDFILCIDRIHASDRVVSFILWQIREEIS